MSAEAAAKVEEAEQVAQGALVSAEAQKGYEVPAETLKEARAALAELMAGTQEAQESLTARIGEVRKAALAAAPATSEMSRWSPRLMKLRPAFAMGLARMKGLLETASSTVARGAANAEQKAIGERDATDLHYALPARNDLANAAEDQPESLGILAKPLLDALSDGEVGLPYDSIAEIAAAAARAATEISEARKYADQKLQEARRFAPETRKLALADCAKLQQKIPGAKAKLDPSQSFGRELQERVAAEKALKESPDKLAVVELEAEGAADMVSVASQGQMSEDEVGSAGRVATPAAKGVAETPRRVEAKLAGLPGGPMKEEPVARKGRISGTHEQLDEVSAARRRHHDGLEAQRVMSHVREKVKRAEETSQLMAGAEVSFLKGVEALPPQESEQALGDCETSAAKAGSPAHPALSSLKQEMGNSMGYGKDVQETFVTDLGALQKHAEGAKKREASHACAEARKVISATQTEAESGLDAAAMVSKLQGRLNAAQQDLAKTMRAAGTGEELAKGKESLGQEEAKVTEAEEEVEELGYLANPAAPGLGGERLLDEALEKIDAGARAMRKTLEASQRLVESTLASAAPALEDSLEGLPGRCDRALKALARVVASTKD